MRHRTPSAERVPRLELHREAVGIQFGPLQPGPRWCGVGGVDLTDEPVGKAVLAPYSAKASNGLVRMTPPKSQSTASIDGCAMGGERTAGQVFRADPVRHEREVVD